MPEGPSVEAMANEAVEHATRAALGRAIAVRRLELGLSRQDLAHRAALSYPFVCEIERGVKQPSASSLRAIADALALSPSSLLARADALAMAMLDLERRGDAAPVVPGGLTSADSPGGVTERVPSWRDPAGAGGRAGGVRAAPADDLSRLVRGMVRDELARLQVGGTPPLPISGPRTSGPASGDGAASRRSLATEEEVREHVLFAAREMLGSEDIEFDAEGDIPIKRGEVMLFIRVLEDPLSVLVFSPILVGVTESVALFSRLNEMNAGVHFVRFCVTHGGVVADAELFGDQFRPALLRSACTAISEAAEAAGAELQREFGGRLFFGDDESAKPLRDTGGYL